MTIGKKLSKIARRLRIHSLHMTSTVGSGHPTSCFSIAEIMACLFFQEMRYNSNNPHDIYNDEFVLSKGHAAPILWACYAEAGIIRQEELPGLRKLASVLEGHPTPLMPWVKAATGSLGQGLSVGVGLALASKSLGSGNRVFVLLGDGECAEGNVWEAANAASNFKLNNLCAIVDVNRLGQSEATQHGHDIRKYQDRFRAFGWNAISIDGHSIPQILNALKKAEKSVKPAVIIAKTVKGKGVSFLEDRDGWHGKPLKGEQLEQALEELAPMPEITSKRFVKKPLKKKQVTLKRRFSLPKKSYPENEPAATREVYGQALVDLGKINDYVMAVDGDVKNSTFSEFFFEAYPERSFQVFIAEQNMAGLAIGLSARGYIPFIASFACFLTRAHDQIRMAAYSRANVKIVGSHAGVSIGEDGPSQMGLEDMAMFSPIPECLILYPSDAYSARACVEMMARFQGMAYLRTTRPKTPVLYKKSDRFFIGGSKTLRKSGRDRVTIIAAGITVHNALTACEELEKEGIFVRVVDAYSVKPIDARGIRRNVEETNGKVIVVEDHFNRGGLGDAVRPVLPRRAEMLHLFVNELPRSGKAEKLMEKFGIGPRRIQKAVKRILKK